MFDQETIYYDHDKAVELHQLRIAFGKYLAGYRPGDDCWSPEDQQALDAVVSGRLIGDKLENLPFVPVESEPKDPPMFFAQIKKSSKYYNQMLDGKGRAVRFPVHIEPDSPGDGYAVRGGSGGRYRLSDVMLFWRDRNGNVTKVKG